MFDFVRNHQRWLQFLLLLLILPAFVLTGVATFNGNSGSDNAVAIIGKRTITQQEFNVRYQKYIEQERARLGDQFDATLYQKTEMQSGFLNELTNTLLIDELIQSGRMSASDEEVKQILSNLKDMPKDAQGHIDQAAYQAELAKNGLTPEAHQSQIRSGIVQTQLGMAYAPLELPVQTEFTTKFFGQARQVEVKPVDLTPYMAQVNITPEQTSQYYEQNQSKFLTPELFDIAYTTVPVSGNGFAVSDEDIKAVLNAKTAEEIQQARADKDAIAAVEKQTLLKKRAAQIDELVSKSPQDLEGVAKNLGAKIQQAQGISRESTQLPAVFADPKIRETILTAALGESKNIAPLTQLATGELLLAKITNYRPAGQRNFDEVKADIEQQLKREGAVKLAVDDTNKNLATRNAQTAIAPAQTLSWGAVPNNISNKVLYQAMGASTNTFPTLMVVSDTDRVDIVRVIREQALPKEQWALIANGVQQIWNTPANHLTSQAYMSALREREGVKLYPERIKFTQ